MSTITLNSNREPSTAKCMLCGGECETFGTVTSFLDGYPPLHFVNCLECQSITFADREAMIGYNNTDFDPEAYYRHYTHVGAGIHGMTEPLAMLDKTGSLLDVGCGFGYVVDYWLKMKRQEACGLEIAAYGKMGKKLLQIPMYHKYLGECPEVDERSFDIVYSSEVIEHTPDPLAYLKALKARCARDGVVVLTAPSARIVLEGKRETDKLAALSPYFHLFLPSEKGMEHLLKEAGFAHYHINDNGMRLYVWASMEPLPEIGEARESFNWQEYFDYLKLLSENENIDISSGARYRLFKDKWFWGQRQEAHQIFLEFEEYIGRHFGIDLRTIRFADIEPHIRADDLHKAPAWLAVSLHVGANIVKRMEKKRVVARNMAVTAEETVALLLSEVKFRQFSQEAEHFFPKMKKNRKKLERLYPFWKVVEAIGL